MVDCTADFERLELSRTTYSGRRLRAIFAQAFEKQALQQRLAKQVIVDAMAIFMAGKVAMGLRSAPRATAARGGGGTASFGRNTLGAAERPIPKLTRRMKSIAERIATGREIRKVDTLVEKFGGKAESWRKMKTWTADGAEIHYYEHPGIGKVGIKWAGFPDPF